MPASTETKALTDAELEQRIIAAEDKCAQLGIQSGPEVFANCKLDSAVEYLSSQPWWDMEAANRLFKEHVLEAFESAITQLEPQIIAHRRSQILRGVRPGTGKIDPLR